MQVLYTLIFVCFSSFAFAFGCEPETTSSIPAIDSANIAAITAPQPASPAHNLTVDMDWLAPAIDPATSWDMVEQNWDITAPQSFPEYGLIEGTDEITASIPEYAGAY
jgi:hypothetical protein